MPLLFGDDIQKKKKKKNASVYGFILTWIFLEEAKCSVSNQE